MERLETARLILRHFTEADAKDVYQYARDPRVGPAAGWQPHKSEGESLEIIRTVFMAAPFTYAVVDKPTGKVIGSAGFVDRHPDGVDPARPDDEIGYALSPDFWGRGLMPEAVAELLRFGFEERGLSQIWCGHYEGNEKSKRVVEKCGFRYCRSGRTWVELMGEERLEHHYLLTKEEWQGR